MHPRQWSPDGQAPLRDFRKRCLPHNGSPQRARGAVYSVCDYGRVLSLWNIDDIARLRTAFARADLTRDGVASRRGANTLAALHRGDFRAMLAATEDGDPQSTLLRLFTCGSIESVEAVAAALDPFPVSEAVSAGLLVGEGSGYRAGMSLDFETGRWLLADLPASPTRAVCADHVLGVSGASRSMSGYMLRREVDEAVDIGTGCGALALELAGHAGRVTATDISSRALSFAATNAELNGEHWTLLAGDLLDPLQDKRFDQIVCNPPFIVGPARTDYDYRDAGRGGDGVCEELARRIPAHLSPGGTAQFLANWVHVEGEDWRDRVASWFTDSGCDVWAIQRDVVDPLDYVRVWQRDAGGEHDPEATAEWLGWFESNDIEAIGFGVINVRNAGASEPTVECEDIRQQPAAAWDALIAAWFDAVRRLDSLGPDGLLDARLRVADGVALHQQARHSKDGWEVDSQQVVDTVGVRRREEVDPLLVSLLGGCQGEATLRLQVDLLAQAHEAPAALLAASLLPVVKRFVRHGYLEIVE